MQNDRIRIFDLPDRVVIAFKPNKNTKWNIMEDYVEIIMNYIRNRFKEPMTRVTNRYKVSVYGKNYGFRHYNIDNEEDLKYMLEERYNMDSLVPFGQYFQYAQFPLPEDTKAIIFWIAQA